MAVPPPSSKTFRVLSLDGGGIRGAFSSACLAKLESSVGRPITDYFDLITGTSTGGIIAVALGLGVPSEAIKDMYRRNGARIFTRRQQARLSLKERFGLKFGLWIASRKVSLRHSLGLNFLVQARYTSDTLERVLAELFQDQTLEMVRTTRLVIPAIDLIKGSTVTFKTPHQPNFVRDRHFRAVDVALATAAAPTYFPAAAFNNTLYCDGGMWANNPSVVGYAEAMKILKVCSKPEVPLFDRTDVRLLSIGTGVPRYFFKPREDYDGMFGWGPQLFEVSSGAQSQGAHFKAQYLVGSERYRRVDFEMPQSPWPLDAIDRLPELLHIGEEKAVEHFPDLKALFLNTVKRNPTFY